MENFKKSGFSAEGRRAPKRARVTAGRVYGSSDSRFSRSEGQGSGHREGGFGENRERRSSFGEHKSFGERKSFGNRREGGFGGERRSSFGGRRERSFGERSFGECREGGFGGDRERRSSFGEHNSFGERKSFGNRREGGFGGERRSSFGGHRERSFGEHKSFGERKSFGDRREGGFGGERRSSFGGRRERSFGERREGGFRKPDQNSGINKMISRRPQVDKLQNSDFDSAPSQIQDEIRLNKYIANSGVCSRREADQFIQAGVVSVNGIIVTELGTKVNVHTDEVKFNGERIKGEEKVYIVMNKPKGFVTTVSDSHADKTVMDLLKGCSNRVFPVGRLDKGTTGVLMFTNDGEITERLTHPSYDKKKIYQVSLDRPLAQEDYTKILSGIVLGDGEIKADELEYIDTEDHRKLGIEIHSGKNRIVRRIFESLGYDVKGLDRVYFAGLTKKGLKRGEWRYLSEGEANVLKMGAYL